MAHYISRLSKEKFSEYLKLGLALKITKEGLQGIVEKETNDFHCTILREISGKQHCSECRIENILECPTTGLCSPKHCSFHSSSFRQPRRCPNDSCNIIKDKIRENFRCNKSSIPEPSWSNTNAKLWTTNAFQVMKCYLPRSKYQRIEKIEDVDLNGLINVIINNKTFDKIISNDLNEKDNIYMKVLEIEKYYHNCVSLTISDRQFHEHLKDMIKLLKETTTLMHDQGAQQAVAKLEQIKSDTLIVNTQTLTEVLSELILSITKEDEEKAMRRGKSKKRSFQKSTTIPTLRLNVICGCHDIFSRDHRNFKICQLESIISNLRGTIHELRESINKLKKPENKETDSGVTELKRFKYEANDTIMQSESPEKSYAELKTELKKDLVQFYRERYNTIPLSPLILDNKASLLEFYVQPAITVVASDKGLFDLKEHPWYKDVRDLADIFEKTKDEPCKNIFLKASPGAGKTTFLKHLALTWSQTQKKDHTDLSKDEKLMQQFDFVFLLSLREARHECKEDNMIKALVISQLDQAYSYTDVFLQEILHKEQCLILMDGLDEWKHPKGFCHLSRSDFPHTKSRKKCTKLTTSRTWPLNTDLDRPYIIDKRLEVQGLGKESSKTLVGKVLRHVKGNKYITSESEQEKQKQFFEMMSSKKLRNFESNPVILMQLLCLWSEERDPGESQCEIYSNMLELLFHRAEMTKRFRKTGKNKRTLPNCFSRKTHCIRNASLFLALGKLAFATLFSEMGESVYVFDKGIAKEHMQNHDIQRCVEVGILSQNEMRGNIATDKIQLSFLHKTFQEFFAALSIAAKPETIREVATKISDRNETVHKSFLQLEILLVFLSGFAPERTSELTSRLRKEIANASVTKEYRETVGTLFLESRLPMNDYCSMITNCVMESICNGHDQLKHFHLEDIFVDDQCMDMKYTRALKSVIEMNSKQVKSLSINVMQTIDKDNTNRILHELNIQQICNLQKLFVWGNIPRVHLQSLLQLSKYSAKCIELWGMQLFSEDIVIISAMTSIESLSFLSILMTHSVFEIFIAHLCQRKRLTQLLLHDVECVDHFEDCPGVSLNLPDQSRLVLLLLDKVNLASIHFNGERLKMCVAEWLPVPGSLKSLLECLSNSETLERFDYDGTLCEEDTKALVQTISSLQNVKYLRLRHIDLSKFSLDLGRLQNLRTVYFSNVSFESDLLQKVADHIRSLTSSASSVTFCMENCEVTKEENFQQVKKHLRSSEEIDIFLDSDKELKQLHIRTKLSDKTLNIVHSTDQENSDWEQCLCEDTAFAKREAERLIKSRNFPDQQSLNKICQKFGRKDELLKTLFTELGASIKNKSEKIVQVIPSFYESDQRENIIFVICTKAALSLEEKETIKEYSYKIRPIGEYSLEGKEVVQNKLFMEQNLSLKELQNLKKCINKHADMLLSKHRQLSIIAPSALRSKFYGTSKAKIIREPCIVLFVHTKNYIPVDEEPFDDHYEGIPIDVREGCFMTHPTIPFDVELFDGLKMGCNIGSVMHNREVGSLGGFIEHPTYGLCGLTCAHVLLNNQWMSDLKRTGSMKWPIFHRFGGVTYSDGTENVIGRIVQAIYTKGVSEQSGMEVALFQIEKHRPNSGMFYGDDDMRFDGGKSNEVSVIDELTVVKIGSKTHKTFGKFVIQEPSVTVRTYNYDLDIEDLNLTLHNQLEVAPLGVISDENRFSKPGDSGSLVFMKKADEYICVGMVEGGTDHGTSIVTPIVPILQACGVNSFKSFETANLTKDLRNLTNTVTSMQWQMNQHFSTIMQEFNNLKNRMRSESTNNQNE